jgi:hypothetical protein
MGIQTQRWISALILLITLPAACTPRTTSPSPSPTRAIPAASLLTAPDLVCGSATQMRLQLQVSENLSADDPGAWELIGPRNAQVTTGGWIVRDGAVLIPFPNNAPLPPGQYSLHLHWREAELAGHTFTIGPPIPTLEMLDVSVVPGGTPAPTLWMESPLRLFYINYAFEDACAGTPYWISTQNAAGETVCIHNGVLESADGTGTVPCYDVDETPFAAGWYETTMTLPGEVSRTVSFEIAVPKPTATPPPTQTPRPPTVMCETSFTAAGITPEGEAYLPRSFFEWYTVAIYTGRVCRNLQPGTPWRSTWSRQGTRVREINGLWEGPPTGLVWDVLTGVPANPFMPPGTYTVTLEIAGNTSEAAFTVHDYTPAGRTD